jgi:hypothetical protein
MTMPAGARIAAQTRAEATAIEEAVAAARAAQQTAAQEAAQAAREAAQAGREAALEGARAQRDAARAIREAQLEVARAGREGQPGAWVRDFPPGGPQIPQEAVIISVAFFVMCAVIAIGFPIARALARRMDRKALAAPGADSDLRMRLERIEHAVDAIAVEVERISEGQRFSTKVLADLRALPGPDPAEALAAPLARTRDRR